MEFLKQGSRKESIAKTMFPQKQFVDDSGVEFVCFSEALGLVFPILLSWRQAWKFIFL